MGNIDKELLHVIRALTVLLGGGLGLEMAMKRIAEGDYGDISEEFRRVLDEAAKGGDLESSLERLRGKTSSEGFRKLITTLILGLKGDTNVIDSLERMAERESRIREVETERFIDMVGTRTEMFMVLGILVPIIIITLVFVNRLIEGPLGGGFPITPAITFILLMTIIGILAALAIGTKKRDPSV